MTWRRAAASVSWICLLLPLWQGAFAQQLPSRDQCLIDPDAVWKREFEKVTRRKQAYEEAIQDLRLAYGELQSTRMWNISEVGAFGWRADSADARMAAAALNGVKFATDSVKNAISAFDPFSKVAGAVFEIGTLSTEWVGTQLRDGLEMSEVIGTFATAEFAWFVAKELPGQIDPLLGGLSDGADNLASAIQTDIDWRNYRNEVEYQQSRLSASLINATKNMEREEARIRQLVDIGVQGFCANERPNAVDDLAQTDHVTPIDIRVLTNDHDPEGRVLRITSATSVGVQDYGNVRISDNGTFADTSDDYLSYGPSAEFHGLAKFTYTIVDDLGLASTATVSVLVHPPKAASTDDGAVDSEDALTLDKSVKDKIRRAQLNTSDAAHRALGTSLSTANAELGSNSEEIISEADDYRDLSSDQVLGSTLGIAGRIDEGRRSGALTDTESYGSQGQSLPYCENHFGYLCGDCYGPGEADCLARCAAEQAKADAERAEIERQRAAGLCR